MQCITLHFFHRKLKEALIYEKLLRYKFENIPKYLNILLGYIELLPEGRKFAEAEIIYFPERMNQCLQPILTYLNNSTNENARFFVL